LPCISNASSTLPFNNSNGRNSGRRNGRRLGAHPAHGDPDDAAGPHGGRQGQQLGARLEEAVVAIKGHVVAAKRQFELG
jgi:hypothetical protein